MYLKDIQFGKYKINIKRIERFSVQGLLNKKMKQFFTPILHVVNESPIKRLKVFAGFGSQLYLLGMSYFLESQLE